MKFIIRDDDPCFFTKVEELENCYSTIYNSIPVCLSVTPFRIAGKYFETTESKEKEMPIHRNKIITEYLKEGIAASRFEIALHGYNHIYYNDLSKKSRIPEYAVSSGLIEKTSKGKKYLEDVFETKLNTFVPPSNTISKHGYNAIIKNKLNLMHAGSYKLNKRPFELKGIKNFSQIKLWQRKKSLPYFHPLKFSAYSELGSFLLYPSSNLNDLLEGLEMVNKSNGVFVLATHYHAFKKKIKSGETIEYAFKKIIERARNISDVQFIGYSDLW